MTRAEEPKKRVQRYFDHVANHYDQRWKTYAGASTRETLRRLTLQPGERVLDVGCGTGTLLQARDRQGRGRSVAGVDLSAAMIALMARDLFLYRADAGTVRHHPRKMLN